MSGELIQRDLQIQVFEPLFSGMMHDEKHSYTLFTTNQENRGGSNIFDISNLRHNNQHASYIPKHWM